MFPSQTADEAIRAPGAHVAVTFAREQERAMAGAVAGAKRSVAARMPPLLNTHSPFTRASTFGDSKDLYHHPPTNRIGANYTPSAGPGYKQRAAKRAKVPNDEGWVNSEIITKRPLPKYPTMAEPRTSRGERVDDALARTARVRPQEPGFTQPRPPSPDNPFRTIGRASSANEPSSSDDGDASSNSDGEVAGSSSTRAQTYSDSRKRSLTDAIVRYHYYVEHGVDTGADDAKGTAAEPKPEWFENVLSMTPSDPDPHGALSVEGFETCLHSLLNEMRTDYYHAARKSIVDYVLTNANERTRLGLETLAGFAKPPKPSGRPHGDLPAVWRADVDAAREDIAWTLQTLSPQISALSHLWSTEFRAARLVDAGSEEFRASVPWEVDAFVAHQSATREASKSALWERWTAETAAVFRADPPVCVNADSDAYYDAVATAQSNQLRELVKRNVEELVTDLAAEHTYPDTHGHCDPLDRTLLWSNDPLFVVRLQPGEDGCAEFSPPYEAFEDAVISSLDGAVLAAIGIPRPGVVNVASAKAIDTFQLDDPLVVDARTRLATAMRRGRDAPDALKAVFAPHESLLTLDIASHVNAFAANVVVPTDPTGKKGEPTVLDQFRSEIDKYRAFADDIRKSSGKRVRAGVYVVDCSSLKQRLSDIADACADALLDHIRTTVANTAIEMNKTYVEMNERVHVKPSNVNEAVQLKKYVKETQPQMTKDIEAEIKAQKKRELFLEEYFWSTTDEDFDEICVSYGWPARMYEIMKLAGRACNSEHRLWEEKLKARREVFQTKLEEYKVTIESFERDGDVDKREEVYAGKVEVLVAALEAAANEAEAINDEEILFGWGITRYTEVTKLNTRFEPFKKLWTMTWETFKNHREWMQGPFSKLNSEVIDENVSDSVRDMAKLVKRFSGKGGGELMPKPLAVAEATAEKLEKFKDMLPMVHAVCNPGLRTRHWEKMTEIIAIPNFELKKDEFTSLQRLIDKGVKEHTVRLAEVSDVASREYTMEKALDKMVEDWEGLDLRFKPWKETGTSILDGACVDEVQAVLDDQIVKVTAMGASPFAKPFADRVGPWGVRLDRLQQIVDQWLKCQAKWLYLEPIFSSDEIGKQIPTEAAAFDTMDTTWRKIMDTVQAAPKAVDAPNVENLLEDLEESNRQLDIVEKGLNDFLDTKKMAFPRFFFLSNDELLEILSEGKDPLRVQPFMKKCFEAVQKVEFTERVTMKTIVSVEGESVPLCKEIDPAETGAVEKWMLEFEDVMKASLLKVTRESVVSYTTKPREEWILDWPGQVVIAGSQVHWTKEVTDAIVAGSLKEYGEKSNVQLTNIVNMVRGELTKLERATMSALVTIDVHARDVVVQMSADGVHDPKDFKWLAQLRYFWEDDTLKCRMINAQAQYGFEYLGNSARLVITPLTDRCYRTLMGAIHLNLGGAPAGPAGTGKTETTKDLSKAIAIACVVFNCSDGLDYKAMGKFFKGLAASGAWACFDEFNRIELEVLSVVAQQVLCIQRAVAAKMERFIFEGVELRIIHTANVFITMNPGYAGRSELPDNLKALFRDVAMMVPDYAMIGEIILYSFGYLEARDMARKLVQTYRLCSEQLSSQDHYDYGMRAVIAVLRAAGNLKRKFADEAEDVLMLRALTDVNLPKFLDQDVPLFRGILSDLFPGVKLPEIDYDNLNDALTNATARAKLQPLDNFFEKIIQLYEMIIVRHGLMLVGESYGMKSSCISVLADALGELNEKGLNGEQKVKYYCLNPKSITMGQLYGAEDPVSKEWADGILAVTFRNAARDTSPDRKWVVFDGPVDAIWIENMNTVLDDNKKLCLNSGEIVAMQGLMNMIFEVQDLAVASPATVSRCGMVYVQPSLLGWRPVMQSWLDTLPAGVAPEHKEQITALFDWLVPPCLRVATKICKMPQPMQEINLAQSLMRLLDSLLDEFKDADKIASMKEALVSVWIDSLFLFSLVWSIGASVDEEGRTKFDAYLRKLMFNDVPEELVPWMTPGLKGQGKVKCKPFPSGSESNPETVYDFCFDKPSGTWRRWVDLTEDVPIGEDAAYSSIIVPTVDTIRYTFLIDTLVTHGKNFCFVGPTGTGKTAYIKRHVANGIDSELYSYTFMNFSAQTSANMTQDIVDGKLTKRKKGTFGPPPGKKMVVFVDDLNMPQVEEYGAQPPIELLRQFMDYAGWYDRRELAFRNLVDMQFIAAMGPPGGGRNNVTNRYLRHYHVICAAPFNAATLTKIFSTLVEWWMRTKGLPEELYECQSCLVKGTTELYQTVQRELLPTPMKSHYTFNLRDVSKVFQGVCSTTKESVADKGSLTRLWVHESLRVFADRLTDEPDREWFFQMSKRLTEKHFDVPFDEVFARLDADGDGVVDPTELRRLMFGDFLVPGADPKVYGEVLEYDQLHGVVTEYLVDFNSTSKKPMHLVLFLYALEHVCRICRVISQPGGHALLVGVGGSGRQSLTRLAAYIQEFEIHQIELSKTYGRVEWHDDLKKVMKLAGEANKNTVFLFSDTQIQYEYFVEDISNLLNTGEVPNLMESGDMVTIFENIRGRAKQAGMDANKDLMNNFFIQEVKKNLHVVLAFSPVGDAFRERLRKFPSLVTCTTIDWFTAWPEDALLNVAQEFLKDVNVANELKSPLAEMCVEMHSGTIALSERYLAEARRHFYVTPTSYLELISSYKDLLKKKQKEIDTKKKRYINGLEKLAATEQSVEAMKLELIALQPQLVQAQKDTQAAMEVIAQETVEADKVKASVAKEEADAKAEAARVKTEADACENDLKNAMPLLKAAVDALDTLTPGDIFEVKLMKTPPAPVMLVMEAVCIFMQMEPVRKTHPDTGQMFNDWWATSLKLLGQPGFLNKLKTYDKDKIKKKVIRKVSKYVAKPEFEPARIKKASKAAGGLCSWVKALVDYDAVIKVVNPKKAALAKAETDLAGVMAELKIKQDQLQGVIDKINALNDDLQGKKDHCAKLENDAEVCKIKLDRANKLVEGLGGEKVRWTANQEQLSVDYLALTGDVLLSSGCIAYLGAFTLAYREQATARWVELCQNAEPKIPCDDKYSLVKIMGDQVKIRQWNIQGLPKDSFSAENGTMVDYGSRWPLFIDPQGQANKWIRSMEGERGLVTIKLSDPDYMRSLETAVQFGKPVLLENIYDTLDASLEPLLLKQTFKQAGSLCIKLGDSVVEYNKEFKFYITTKLRNPHYTPELCTKVSLINFMITLDGLEDQLLGVVVAKERPDLAEEKNQLILQGAQNKKSLKEIEDKILKVLSSSEGNILEDEEAVQVLSASKVLSDEISEKQKIADETEVKIDSARAGYRPVAKHSSILFFCVADMANIGDMYQYSLQWYTELFLRGIDDADRSPKLETRLRNITRHFTYFLYQMVCRSLFEQDKLLFAFLVATKVLLAIDWGEIETQKAAVEAEYQKALADFAEREAKRTAEAEAEAKAREEAGEDPSADDDDDEEALREAAPEPPGEFEFAFGTGNPIDADELRFFLTGGIDTGDLAVPNPAPDWLGDKAWGEILRAAELPTVAARGDLPADVAKDPARWKVLYDSLEPQSEVLPAPWHDAFTPLQRMMVIRAFRPDKVVPAITDFVGAELGSKYVEPMPFDLPSCFEDSSASVPLVFVLSSGSDPMANLLNFAASKKNKTYPEGMRVEAVSLGQGQGPYAMKNIEEGMKKGFWVVLQNCHLAKSFMPELEVVCETRLKEDSVHQDFRLWLTSYPSPIFPITILENSVKMTNEAPKGLRAGLMRTFMSDPLSDSEFFDTCTKDTSWRKMCFGLAFFHSSMQERRKYGAIGFNIPYDFNENDLRISIRQLKMFLDEYPEVPYETLMYTCGECNYGGKITDGHDRVTADSILKLFYTPEILDENYAFSPSGLYQAPPHGDYKSYLKYINTLPLIAAPEVYGFHANADIQKNMNETDALLASFMLTQSREGSGGGKSPEEVIGEVAESLLGKLPPNFDVELAEKKYPVDYYESMNTVLTQELGRVNVLLSLIRGSLVNLGKAVKGQVLMSDELDKVGKALYDGKVPASWLKKSFPSLKPLGSYMKEVVERAAFFKSWVDDGIPTTFPLYAFFFTQAFLTGSKQNFARSHKIEIDKVDFDYAVLDGDEAGYTEKPADGVYCFGMHIDGAAWDPHKRSLCESEPKVLYAPCPGIHMIPARVEDFKEYNHYRAPLYKTADRRGILSTTGHSTNFVMDIRVPCEQDGSHWIRRGAALLLSLKD